jgi:hypothetical protein
MAQLSGDEIVADCAWLTAKGVRVVKAVRPKTSREIAKLEDFKDHVFAFNIDAFKEGQYGGTGTVAEWALARQAKQFGPPVILAGGLNGANVVTAVKAVEPSALDVCSGVEREPGKKDAKKLKGFFEALWKYDEELRRSGGGEMGTTGKLPPSITEELRRAKAPPSISTRAKPVAYAAPASAEPAKPAADAAVPEDASGPAITDQAARAAEQSSVVPPLPPTEGAAEADAPLSDWASASAAVKKKPDPPRPPPRRKF